MILSELVKELVAHANKCNVEQMRPYERGDFDSDKSVYYKLCGHCIQFYIENKSLVYMNLGGKPKYLSLVDPNLLGNFRRIIDQFIIVIYANRYKYHGRKYV